MDAFATATAAIAAHSSLAYGAVFVLAFLEAVPVVGSVVPGSALIIATAALVPSGTVKMWPLMAAAILGAVLGDGLPYWAGHRYRAALLARWPLSRYPGLVERSRALLDRHGGKSIFLARFTPAVRGFVPVVAGIAGMPAGRFYVVNILSAFVWAPVHILPGMLLGASVSLAGAAAGRLMILLVVLVLLVWLLVSAVRLAVRRGPGLIAVGEARLWEWSSSRDSWLARQLRALVDPERSEVRVLVLWGAVVIAAAWLFLGVLEDVVTGDPLVRVDGVVYRALQGIRTPAGDAFMIGITELGDTIVTTSMTIVIFAWLAWRRAWRSVFYWVAAVGFAATLNTVTKLAIHRARPAELAYAGASAFSFPSGHATINAVLYGFLAFLIARQLRPAWRLPLFAVAAAFAALIAFSRLYLGAHWFSDVTASLAFAAAWVALLALAYVHHHEKPFDRRGLAVVACGTLILVGGANIFLRHAADTQRYAVRYEIPTIAAADWWMGGWTQMPVYRVDITGETEEPLTFQWAGTLQHLATSLLASGWHKPVSWSPSSTLAWLATADPTELPVVPSLEAGRMPDLTLIRVTDRTSASRRVLRLWPADLRLRDGPSRPLWIGSIVEERISRPLSFVTVTRTTPDIGRLLELLTQSVEGGRLVQRGITTPHWDGRVLLARQASANPSPDASSMVSQ